MLDVVSRLKIGDYAPHILVEDIQSQSVDPAQYWAQGPTLITFLRHFG